MWRAFPSLKVGNVNPHLHCPLADELRSPTPQLT
jgi:hypothetical protein